MSPYKGFDHQKTDRKPSKNIACNKSITCWYMKGGEYADKGKINFSYTEFLNDT